MGATKQEKNANFLISAEKYMNDNSHDQSTHIFVKKFLEFYSQKGLFIGDYEIGDFKEFFREYRQTPMGFAPAKSRLMKLLKTVGENGAAEVLEDVEITFGTNYIRDFDTLYKGIQDVRYSEMPFLKYMPERENCDKLTMGEVILYLAWIGVPQNMAQKLPLTAIDLDRKVVTADRDYSFADYPIIDKIFTRYKNSMTFDGIRKVNDKVHFVTYDYNGDKIVRVKQKTSNASDASIRTLVSRVFSSFKFARSYLNVYRSGQFSRAYQKYSEGKMPDFKDSESLLDYFGVSASEYHDVYKLKKDWNAYLDWIENNQ